MPERSSKLGASSSPVYASPLCAERPGIPALTRPQASALRCGRLGARPMRFGHGPAAGADSVPDRPLRPSVLVEPARLK